MLPPPRAMFALGSATQYRSNSVGSVAQSWRMSPPSRSQPPLNAADLDRFALRYVERFATTRGRLAAYLARKIRERGWAGDTPPDPEAVAERMAERGYVNDRAFAESRVRSMSRRGLGARRVEATLRHDGIDAEDSAAVAPAIAAEAAASALAFARRKRIGPYAREAAERAVQEKQLAAMLRAGHDLALSRRIVRMAPEESVEGVLELGQD